MNLIRAILDKLNAQSVLLFLAAVLLVAGVIFIHRGVKDDGAVDLTTPFITGKLRSGFVGITLLFLALPLCGWAAWICVKNKTELTATKGDISFTYHGSQILQSDWKEFATTFARIAATPTERIGEASSDTDRMQKK